MADKDYVVRLENVIKQMLTPLRDIPFNLVIESMSGKKVISFDLKNPDHKELLGLLKQAALQAGKAINKTGILRPRPNEVGNDIEPFIKRALNSLNLNADVPTVPTPHFLMSFEIYVAGESGRNHIYKCRHYKILSLESLSLDVKYEFNSDNKRMYSGESGTIILDEGEIR